MNASDDDPVIYTRLHPMKMMMVIILSPFQEINLLIFYRSHHIIVDNQ